jgi:hypothetical protein
MWFLEAETLSIFTGAWPQSSIPFGLTTQLSCQIRSHLPSDDFACERTLGSRNHPIWVAFTTDSLCTT